MVSQSPKKKTARSGWLRAAEEPSGNSKIEKKHPDGYVNRTHQTVVLPSKHQRVPSNNTQTNPSNLSPMTDTTRSGRFGPLAPPLHSTREAVPEQGWVTAPWQVGADHDIAMCFGVQAWANRSPLT